MYFPLPILSFIPTTIIPHVKQLQSMVYKFKTIVGCTVAGMDLPQSPPSHQPNSILIIFLNPFPPSPYQQNSNRTTLNLIRSYLSLQNSLPHFVFVVFNHYRFIAETGTQLGLF